jgi:hypothetical protein
VDAEPAAELLAELVSLGLIEEVEPKTANAEWGFELTSRGEAFADASAAKPVFRKTAERFCSCFLERPDTVQFQSWLRLPGRKRLSFRQHPL